MQKSRGGSKIILLAFAIRCNAVGSIKVEYLTYLQRMEHRACVRASMAGLVAIYIYLASQDAIEVMFVRE